MAPGLIQLQHERPADMIGYADNHSVLATHGPIGVCKQGHHALRGTWPQATLAQNQATNILGLKAIDILVRINTVDQCIRIDMLGQRQLDEDAMYARIRIQAIDQCGQFGLRRVFRQIKGH